LIFKLGGFQQFKNNWFSLAVFTSWISKKLFIFLKNYFFNEQLTTIMQGKHRTTAMQGGHQTIAMQNEE
jgi:hypothetical protein